jgi:hypothetical protein
MSSKGQLLSLYTKVEALVWAMFYEDSGAQRLLRRSLGSEAPGDILKAICALGLSSCDEKSMGLLASLPVLVESNRATDCWLQWAWDSNDESKLAVRLQQFIDMKSSTPRSASLRTSKLRIEVLQDTEPHEHMSAAS